MTRSVIAWLLFVSIGMAAIPSPIFADDGRTLGGYRFIPVSGIEDPFVVTRFGNYTAVAYAGNVEFPILVIDGSPPDTLLALNGNFLFVVASFDFQYAVHPRVAVGLSARGASRLGTSAQALLSQGVSAVTAFTLDGLFELWRNDRVVMTASAEVGYSDGLVISFTKFVEDILIGNVENASIVSSVEGVRAGGGLGVAWALNEWSGITGTGKLGYSRAEWFRDELLWRLAAAGTVDFGQRGNAPVGLSLALDADGLQPATVDAGTILGVIGGVYYTGRDDLNLGLEVKWWRLPLEGWDTVAYPMSFGITLDYYF